MTMGLQIFDSSGAKTFDSTTAIGGVCLGFYSAPAGGGSVSFPNMIGRTGFLLPPHGVGAVQGWSYDNSLGYLRFNFPAVMAAVTVLLFAK